MKTLILNGSPRPHGDTATLIAALRENLQGEVLEIACYRAKISPCVDCRKCKEQPGCVIQDDMQQVYDFLETCDNVVIATPVYYSLPTAPILSVASRLQTYFCASFFRKQPVKFTPKRGAMLLAGGGSGGPQPAIDTCRRLLKVMRAREIAEPVLSGHTDDIPACEDEAALTAARKLADFLNEPR